ncbi:MAG: YtxH domain-containing protein [Desulfopila sp.]
MSENISNFQQTQPQMMYQQPLQSPHSVYPATYPALPQTTNVFGLNLQDSQFWKGALLGAAVAVLVTNESVQKGVVKSISRLTAAAQSGIEEMKEKFEDAKAEAKAEAAATK